MRPESKLKLRIADREFELVLIDSRDSLKNNSASASEWQQRIVICQDDRRPDGLMSDLWHEVIEMINCCYGFKMEHQTITTLASAIHQVLRDNPQTLLTIARKGEQR
jgi:hypothetical protein